MPLTTIYDGGTRIVGDANAIEQSLHPTVMAYINIMRSSTGGNYSMTINQIDAVNNMVQALVANGIWTKIKAIYPVIGGTAAAHKFNLIDPRDADAAFRLNFVGGWTHASTGMTPNGTTGYANTFLNATTVQTTNHLAFYSRTLTVGTGLEMGAATLTYNQLRASNTSGNYGGYLSGALNLSGWTTTNDARGFWIGSKISNSDRRSFRNGIQQGSNLTSDTNVHPNLNIWIGGRNDSNFLNAASNKECALASIGDGLTAVEALAFYQIVQAFQTKLGRQV